MTGKALFEFSLQSVWDK